MADVFGLPTLPSLLVPEHDLENTLPVASIERRPINHVTAAGAAVRAFGAAQLEKAVAPPTPYGGAIRHAIVAAHAEVQRGCTADRRSQAAGTPWSGLLRDPWVRDYLVGTHGPNRVWTTPQLELYARCPFVYLVRYVLALEGLAAVEDAPGSLTFDGIAHTILDRFFASAPTPYPAKFTAEAAALLKQSAEEVFGEAERDRSQWLGLPSLWWVTRQQLHVALANYLRHELPRIHPSRRREVDWANALDGGTVEIAAADLQGNSVALRLACRIDRVDATDMEGGEVLRVVDYTSDVAPTAAWYAEGSTLRVPLHMKALSSVSQIGRGALRSINPPDDGVELAWGDAGFERALHIAGAIPSRVCSGRFETSVSKAAGWSADWPGPAVTRAITTGTTGSRFDE
jgi:hypothetical protein